MGEENTVSMLNKESAIQHLILNNLIEQVESRYESRASVVSFNHTVNNAFDGRITHSIKYASLRIRRSTLIWMYNNTKSHIVKDFISSVYRLGIGLPKDYDCAEFWKKQAYGGCVCPAYKQYRQKLQTHIQQCKGYYCYTNDVNKQKRLLELISPKRGYEKCAVIYRSSIGGYRFHNLVLCDNNLMFELQPRFFKLDDTLQMSLPNVKYVASLGHVKKGADYRFKDNIHDIASLIANEPLCERENIVKFARSLSFVPHNTLLIDYKGRVNQYELKDVNKIAKNF